MLRTMIKVEIPKNDEELPVKIPRSVKHILSVVSKINNKTNKAGDPYWFYNEKECTLYVLKDYMDGEYDSEAIRDNLGSVARDLYQEIAFGEAFLNTIRSNHLPMIFVIYEGLDFCVSYEKLIPGEEDFSEENAYDYSNSWVDICSTDVVETALKEDDQLSDFAYIFGEPNLTEYGKDVIREKMTEAPYCGVIPECIPIEQVISDLCIDFSDDYMLDAPEYDR